MQFRMIENTFRNFSVIVFESRFFLHQFYLKCISKVFGVYLDSS